MKNSESTIKLNTDIPKLEASFIIPKTKWQVVIPKGGNFAVAYSTDLSWWMRQRFKFIGWDVIYKGD